MTDATAGTEQVESLTARLPQGLEDRVISILETVVGFDTTSALSNLPMIEWLEAELSRLGAKTRRFPSQDGTKANLWATFGPEDKPGVVLSGHTDVVPTAGQDWTSDPYRLRRDGDCLFGRGTCDMKGFFAVVLAVLPVLDLKSLRYPLHLSFSYDEEVGIVGVRGMLKQLAEEEVRPFACLIGEPTDMNIVIAHKGKRAETVVVSGEAIHSGLAPKGVNAIYGAADLIRFIRDLQPRLAAECASDPAFEIPYPTVNVGPVRGGISVATVADECRFDYEIRGGLGTDFERYIEAVHSHAARQVLPAMRGEAKGGDIRFEFHTDYPAFEIDRDHPLVGLAASILPAAKITKLSGGTEAGLFASITDTPTIVVGPGSIAQAHQADEFVDLDQLMRCAAFLREFLDATVLGNPERFSLLSA